MKTTYKITELSQKELYAIEGGSELSNAIWEFVGFCCTLNSRKMAANNSYQENFYNR
ncbi:hypothetical protein FACS1894162_0240 [Bacteroidia bacterium]|nr:hypothetical protein FACS1894162_0240 [Bacteroidia bacterium]